MVGTEELLERLDKDDLKGIIGSLCENDENIRRIVEDYVRKSLDFDSESIYEDVNRTIARLDDYAFLEAGIVGGGKSVSDIYSEEKAAAAIAEAMFSDFYERVELMIELGMLCEARAFISAVSKGLRRCHKDGRSTIMTVSRDFPLRYADNLESYLNTDDILGGFGKR